MIPCVPIFFTLDRIDTLREIYIYEDVNINFVSSILSRVILNIIRADRIRGSWKKSWAKFLPLVSFIRKGRRDIVINNPFCQFLPGAPDRRSLPLARLRIIYYR